MTLSISKNIRRLRREKNITQETLAELLGVSTQAVSKWEREETYPDITMLIPLASYFGVSIDELLGLDAAKQEARIQEYLDKNRSLSLQGRWTELVELAVQAHKEFPNDFRIIYWYMDMIVGGKADNPADVVVAHADELCSLCQHILDECTDDFLRDGALNILAKVYKAQGDTDKALKLLEHFPTWSGCTQGQKSEQLFDKATDEWWYWIQRNFFELSDFAIDKLGKIILYGDKPFDEKERLILRTINYIEQIVEEANYEPFYVSIGKLYSVLAKWSNWEGRSADAIHYYGLALEYGKKFDDFQASERQLPHTNRQSKYDIAADWGGENRVKTLLSWLESSVTLEELRTSREFQNLLDKYRPFAKDLPR